MSARLIAAVIGLVYLALGVAGFFTPGTAATGHDTGRTVWLFSASGVLNIVHTVIGVLGLLAATKLPGALAYCWTLFVGFTGLTAYGVLATAFEPREDPINVNWADNWLHGLTALLALATAVATTRRFAPKES